MSSFVGHSLAALTIFSFKGFGARSLRLAWLAWLLILASAPDVDYLFRILSSPFHQGVRITHSVALGLALPFCTIVVLFFLRLPKDIFKVLSAQAVGAGLSHLILDFLVGVTPLPLLWPVSMTAFRLSFGLLPSAGRIDFLNYYFYRNLLIELGILVPLFYGAAEIYRNRNNLNEKNFRLFVLLLTAVCFTFWSISLKR